MTRTWVSGVRIDLRYSRRAGYKLVAWARWEVVAGQRLVVTYEVSLVPKKPGESKAGEGPLPRAADPCTMFHKTPELQKYLIDLAYEDGGGARRSSRLFVDTGGGEYLVTLKDPTECRQLRVRVRDLGTAWVALEALLCSNSCPWEVDQYELDRRPKQKKKGS